MENASKALIIAGAILLAILLISLGIMIFTQAQDVVSGSGMTEAQITAFNDKFLKYEGKQKGTMVKQMIQDVLATNSGKDNNDGIGLKVTFEKTGGTAAAPSTIGGATTSGSSGGTSSTSNTATSKIVNNNNYEVELDYGTSGRVETITVKGTFK